MNTQPANAGRFSDKLCRNRLAWCPKARSTPECPKMNNDRRRDISIENATAFAAVHSFAQGLLLDDSTFWAGLRSAARVYLDDLATGSCSLVVEHRDQLRPGGVVNFAGEHTPRQPADVEVFNGYAREAVYEVSGELMQRVTTASSDSCAVAGESVRRLFPARRPALTSRNGPLSSAQTLGRALCPVRTRNGFPGRQRDQRGKTSVYAHGVTIARDTGFYLYVTDNVPFPVLTRQHGGLGTAGKRAMPLDFNFAWDANETNSSRLAERHPVTYAELRGMVSCGRPKTWESWLLAALKAAKKSIERFVHAAQHLLFGTEGPLGKAGIGGTGFLQLSRLHRVLEGHAPALPGLNALLQGGIIKCAEIREHSRHCGMLRAVRVHTKFVGKKQRESLSFGILLQATGEWFSLTILQSGQQGDGRTLARQSSAKAEARP